MTKSRSVLLATTAIAIALLASPAAQAQSAGKPIPQPIVDGLKLAPDSARIDLVLPKFSNPTTITNPLFPISSQESVVLVGDVDGKPFRTEVTLMPYTRIIKWDGVEIEAAISQYVAYSNGRITESAIDLYAQADDGSVWYLGEDVADFEDGVIITNEGTWHAGVEGPPAMIMPANPQIGQVYRTENWPGVAFEEVTVKSTGIALDGPFDKIAGAVVGSELHMDGGTEDKQFAPGYGEFYTANVDGDVEALALAVPANRASGPMPAEIGEMFDGAMAVLDAAGAKDWKSAAASAKATEDALGRVAATEVPALMKPVLTKAVAGLSQAVAKKKVAGARQAAIEAAKWSNDLRLRYMPATEIDRARLDLWAAQLQLDAAAGRAGDVRGDVFTMVLIKDRFIRELSAADGQNVNQALGDLQSAAKDAELEAAAEAARNLRALLANLPAKG